MTEQTETEVYLDPALDDLGVFLIEKTPEPGQKYWKVVHVDYWNKQQSQGRHHIYVRTIDENGEPLEDVPVTFAWPDGTDTKRTRYQQIEPFNMANYPMYAAGSAYTAFIKDGEQVSDKVTGMGLGDRNSPNHTVHVSFLITFQLTTYQPEEDTPEEPGPEPEPDPEEPDDDQDTPEELPERYLYEINLARHYRDNLMHGTTGHFRLLLIAELADRLGV